MEDEIYCAIPTMPSRLPYVHHAINSLLPQVDKMFICANNYEPFDVSILDVNLQSDLKGKIEIYLGRDFGSIGRFYWSDKVNGYYITCDDDLIYPPDYVKYMISKIEQYKRQAIITLHGKILDLPLVHWIGIGPGKMKTIYACLAEVNKDYDIHVAGTGAMAYHTDTMKLRIEDFKNNNLDDVEFSILAQKQNIPLIVVKHEKGYLKYLDVPSSQTIWAETEKNPWPLIRLAQSHNWQLSTLAQ